jgi:LAGLIDADG endonuclease
MGRPRGGDAVAIARLDATPPLAASDGHALAGFIEAEGWLGIVPSTDRRSWRCVCSVGIRDDDFGLLRDFQRITGLGSLARCPAQGNAAPQVAWNIASRVECAHLVEILDTYPMRGRKSLEFQAWADAIQAWTKCPAGRPAAVRERIRLSRAAAHLATVRRYVYPPRRLLPGADDELGLRDYLGGFFTGEGSLTLNQARPRVTVNLRADDRPLLELFASSTGLGKLYDAPACGTSRPSTRWVILRHDELSPAVALLNAASLRGRKREQFLAWRRAALEIATGSRNGDRPDRELIELAVQELRRARIYRPPAVTSIAVGHVGPSARGVFVGILQAWADDERGPLSAEAYSTAARRRGHWPSRNTVTRLFGSWGAALEAAGLANRGAVSDEVRRTRVAASRTARRGGDDERRSSQRAIIVAAVRQLAAELGRRPAFQEFAQWRAEHRPDIPSVSTLYRCFPGGWDSVLASALDVDGYGPPHPCATS